MRRGDAHLKGLAEGDPALVAAATALGCSPLTLVGRRPGRPGSTVPICATRYLASLAGEPVSVRVVPVRPPERTADAICEDTAWTSVASRISSPHVVGIRVRLDGGFVLVSTRMVNRVWAAAGPDVPDLGFPGLGSPEDGPGGHPVPASDVYRLGLLAHLVLTGKLPIDWDVDADPDGALLRDELRSRAPVPVREHRADLPHDLATVIDRCLTPAAGDRILDADALLTALTK